MVIRLVASGLSGLSHSNPLNAAHQKTHHFRTALLKTLDATLDPSVLHAKGCRFLILGLQVPDLKAVIQSETRCAGPLGNSEAALTICFCASDFVGEHVWRVKQVYAGPVRLCRLAHFARAILHSMHLLSNIP